MDIIRQDSPTARLLAEAVGDEPFTLVDVGCSGGIDAGWRLFGERLRAYAFDPGVDEIQRLSAAETHPHVHYVAGFVGLPDGHPLKDAAVEPWLVDPWPRLQAARTRQLHQTRDQVQAAAAEPPSEPAPSPEPHAPGLPAAEPAAAAAAIEADQQDLMERSLWHEDALKKEDRTIVLPQFLAEAGVEAMDFIKIDVDSVDFEILRSLDEVLADKRVLGAMLEVSYHGSDNEHFNTFHNTDRFMRAHGFDLYGLTTRPYAMAALPRPFQHRYPWGAQTTQGRPLQGDALYLRDFGHTHADRDLSGLSDDRLLKLGALYALFGLVDNTAALLLHFRERFEGRLDVRAALDGMVAEVQDADPDLWAGRRFAGYADYIAAYEADDPAFYSANDRRHEHALEPLRQQQRLQGELDAAHRRIADLERDLDAARQAPAPKSLLGRLLGR
jgi:hypothetical protein